MVLRRMPRYLVFVLLTLDTRVVLDIPKSSDSPWYLLSLLLARDATEVRHDGKCTRSRSEKLRDLLLDLPASERLSAPSSGSSSSGFPMVDTAS